MDDGEDIYVENPTFRSAYPMEPLHYGKRLRWDYKVHLIGEKVVDPLIHTCEVCIQPILSYGRMIPCKHAFCLDCAKNAGKRCPRCKETVTRVEQSPLGSVFICTFNGQKQLANGCRRTYLSQRDLNSHVAHRHLQNAKVSPVDPVKSGASRHPLVDAPSAAAPVVRPEQTVFTNPGAAGLLQSVNALLGHLQPQMVPPPIRAPTAQPLAQPLAHLPMVQKPPMSSTTIESYQTSTMPPIMATSRTNLITVPIQEEAYRHPNAYTTALGAAPAAYVQPPVNPLAPALQSYISSTLSAQVPTGGAYPPQISMAGSPYSTQSVPAVPHPGTMPHHVPPPQMIGGPQQAPSRFPSPHQPYDDGHNKQYSQTGGSPRMPWNAGNRPPGPVPPPQRTHSDSTSYSQYY
ncbi:hypothetical protein SNE40_004119 [Patella caerulea]|uniref:E3 ubiquitin-protein ligase Hakai n=1 Tax=Patella caerulea TaxID=87958 RepID=A0AAN8K9B4_PATCE